LAHSLGWKVEDALLTREGRNMGKLSEAAVLGLVGIRDWLFGGSDVCVGTIKSSMAPTIVKSALLQLSVGQIKEAKQLISLLKSEKYFDEGLTKLLTDYFGHAVSSLPWNEDD
jgi:hypothetical protein